jgi:beta-glucoside operon transcriptional antiterminator
MKIAKVFNNSVVLGVDEHGREVVLLGRGLGFQKGPGADVDEAFVERRFVPGGSTSVDRLAEYLQELPSEDIDIAEEIIRRARNELGPQVSDNALFPLADHISFALRRIRDGIPMEYPLQWEIASLYPKEYDFAKRMLDLIGERRGADLPPLEAVPLALHFVNAQFGTGEMSATMKVTQALIGVLRTASRDLGVELDDDSVDVARFVTHVRYLILRRMRGQQPAGVDPAVGSAVRSANPDAYRVAEKLADELSGQFGWQVGDDERFYLALHASRLVGRLD